MTHTFDARAALNTLRVQDSNVEGKLAEAVIGAPAVSMSTTQIAQVDMTIRDADFDLLRSGLFTAGSSFRFQGEKMEVAVVETGGTVQPMLTVKARSKGVQILKREKGEKVWRDLSPTELVKQTAKRLGMDVVAQPSPRRSTISRAAKDTTGGEPESMWRLLRNLAAEEGFILFEAKQTLYFGAPTWLMDNAETTWNLGFPSRPGTGSRDIYSMTIPVCRRSANDEDDAVEITFEVPFSVGIEIRPGDALALSGVPSFTGTYLIDSVSLSLDGRSPVSVSASTPVDPEPQDEAPDPVAGSLGIGENDLFGEGIPEYDDDPGVSPAFGTGDFIWPVRGVITSNFGPRNGRQHKGVDIGGNARQRIVAAADGIVTRAGWSDSYGWVVYLDHSISESDRIRSFETRYAHMYAKPQVRVGQYVGGASIIGPNRVSQGQTLGYVGSTGRSTGPHLHFEVRIEASGSAVDPKNYLSGLPLTVGTNVPRGVR